MKKHFSRTSVVVIQLNALYHLKRIEEDLILLFHRGENRGARQGDELDEEMDERVREWKLKKLEHDIPKKLKNIEDEQDAVEGASYMRRDEDEQVKLLREEKLERAKRDFKDDEFDQEALERALLRSRIQEEEADLERAIYRSLVQEESAIYGSLADLAEDK